MGTEGETERNQQDQAGQAQGNQGQPTPDANQPVEVELADGTRVSLEELKSGYLKDADYRKKTAEIADERRRLQQQEREQSARYVPRSQANLEPEPEEEENPLAVVVKELAGIKTYVAHDLLTREINRLSEKYPDADKATVYNACWSNPYANIEGEMTRSQEAIQAKIAAKMPKGQAPATLDEFFKANPKAKEDYDRKVQEDFMRKKAQKSTDTKTVASTSSGSAETVRESQPRSASYREATAKLKEQFKEEGDESF